MPRPKGSKNKKNAPVSSVDYEAQIAEKMSANPMAFLYHPGTQFLYNDLYAALS